MDWGEKYDEYSPMFNIILTSNNYSLEESIVFFGENNFKKQLFSLYNVINNKEEQERIINYNNERIENRPYILDLIKFYIEKNKDILSPWEKYDLGLEELMTECYKEPTQRQRTKHSTRFEKVFFKNKKYILNYVTDIVGIIGYWLIYMINILS